MEPKQVFEKLCRLDPESALSHFTLGRHLYLQGELEEALQALDLSIQKNPDYLLAYLFAGQAYEKNGAATQAVKMYKRGKEKARSLGDKTFEQQFSALEATAPNPSQDTFQDRAHEEKS